MAPVARQPDPAATTADRFDNRNARSGSPRGGPLLLFMPSIRPWSAYERYRPCSRVPLRAWRRLLPRPSPPSTAEETATNHQDRRLARKPSSVPLASAASFGGSPAPCRRGITVRNRPSRWIRVGTWSVRRNPHSHRPDNQRNCCDPTRARDLRRRTRGHRDVGAGLLWIRDLFPRTRRVKQVGHALSASSWRARAVASTLSSVSTVNTGTKPRGPRAERFSDWSHNSSKVLAASS